MAPSPSASRAAARGAALGTALACLALAPALSAQTSTALSWVREPGAESCIAATELGRRVERIVGPVLAAASEGQVSIEGRIGRRGAGFAAAVVVSDADGQILGRREVQSPGGDCRAMDEQLAFVIAVAIDPNAALAALPGEFVPETEPGPELLAELEANPPTPAPFARGTPADPPAPEPDAAGRDSALGFSAGAGIAAALGALPDLAAGVAADVALVTGSWSHHLRAAYWLPQRESIGPGWEVELGLLQLGLASCPQLWAESFAALALCAGVVTGRLHVGPRGFIGTSYDRWLFGPTLELRARLRVAGPVWAVLSAGGQSLWPRHVVAYEQGGAEVEVHRVPAVMPVAALSFELRF